MLACAHKPILYLLERVKITQTTKICCKSCRERCPKMEVPDRLPTFPSVNNIITHNVHISLPFLILDTIDGIQRSSDKLFMGGKPMSVHDKLEWWLHFRHRRYV